MTSRSLSWSARPFAELVRLAWPIGVSMLSFGVMTLVDTLFVSTLGTSALAGVGLAGTATFALYCFSFGLLRGTKVLVSQAVGANRRDELGATLGAAIVAALVLGALTMALGEVVARALPLLAETRAAGEAARSYLQIRCLGAPLVLGFVALRELRYGLGDSRSPMVAGLVGNGVNIVLNAWMVLSLGWGVRGSATATLFGHAAELAVVVLAHRRDTGVMGGTRIRDLAPRHLRALVRVGAPTGVQFLLEMGSFAMLTAIISRIGEVQLAGHQIALQVIHFSFLPTIALAEAGSVMAGQAVGAGRDELVLRVARAALVLSTIYTGAWTLLMGLLGGPIVSLFTHDAVLAPVALSLLHVAACFQIADGAATVARGVLRGAGDVHVPARLGVLCAWVFTPPLAWLLGSTLGLGALGGWIGLCLEITVLSVLCWWRLERGHWRSVAAEARARLAAEEGARAVEAPVAAEVAA